MKTFFIIMKSGITFANRKWVISLLRLELLRDVPSLLEVFFPVLCPRASEVIDESRFAGNQFRRLAIRSVDDGALHPALDEVEAPLGIVRAGTQLPWRDRV